MSDVATDGSSPRGVAGRIWLDGDFRPGWLTWAEGRIDAVAAGPAPPDLRGRLDILGDARVIPGFVDTLLHGFDGEGCATAAASGLATMSGALARAGVTSFHAGFYPLPPEELREAARRWSAFRDAGDGEPRARAVGWHVEGPFVDPEMAGALPPAGLQAPGAAAARAFLEACDGWVRISTIGPEVPGALDAATELHAAGVLNSIGHTRATHADCLALLETVGEVAITHLGNRVLPLAAREPGPIGFAMEGAARWVGIIPDGVHVAPRTLALLARHPEAGPRLMFQSDNLAHAGRAADDFVAGGKRLHRDGAAARDAEGQLGGTLDPLPELLRARVADGSLDWPAAIRGGCEVPGDLVGDCGRLVTGRRADLAALDADGRVVRTWIEGAEVRRAAPRG